MAKIEKNDAVLSKLAQRAIEGCGIKVIDAPMPQSPTQIKVESVRELRQIYGKLIRLYIPPKSRCGFTVADVINRMWEILQDQNNSHHQTKGG